MSYSNKSSRALIRDATMLNYLPQELLDSQIYEYMAHHGDNKEEKSYFDTLHAIEFRPIQKLLSRLPVGTEIIESTCEYDMEVTNPDMMVEGSDNIIPHFHYIFIEAPNTEAMRAQLEAIFLPVSENVEIAPIDENWISYDISSDYSPMISTLIETRFV